MINFRLVKHLYLFAVVAEERHFRRAAERLGMSQPPLSEQIQTLEASLKVKLFQRSSRGVQLTAEGAAILPAVQRLVAHMEKLDVSVKEAIAGKGRVLTIGAITSAMTDPLPTIIEQVKIALPDIKLAVVEIDSADAIEALESGSIDFALARIEGTVGTAIRSRPLLTDRLAVALPAWHRLAKRKALRINELADEDFVMFPRAVSPSFFDGIIAACHAHGFTPRLLHEARSVASQVAMVGCSQGIALVPSGLRSLGSDAVSIKPLREVIEIVTIALAWSGSNADPTIARVIDVALGTNASAPGHA
ncbi:Ben and cat operon transcriptional regulator [Variovorax sp. SRS16]|uniref:LysR family transcriptional regulator n=1 Tax=Variovorax sp. SRS16 TaxID=282217 RepID=UPI00131958CF|nr:LysR family transcriptional regulator [Variovorax sp. SRS16]VTU33185.1 Ben and cat operon transcriptional regulator [Variovorax sp. SRS16]